ncbi:hypothetical protein SELMODRAFT_109689 [Selaginella moellendorffii]|uniref:GRAM domain-containing protein n=1 Tax=Selaginella moellendorffii TaxID=88036 RepID=D8S6U6_SELML|nr:UPF0664 stress-induced protein C29B12.11c [Selaginella moellendorffii]XP_002991508.1 UPF0664 stress-induced protein C29B12.11c [Selaginella moellendorffii]EFJ07430.1 hypothetical protein SELMODRAFT_236300 [Selaginella moellendorffii]EFJ19995.1 hypothetical protein SELMODRAFT_109689 [Selaginella moellendorffii]|eukprot:XP_002979038.1 UPF0664 stress-induced protein C29B12.11c [Selaginella moellendorffii]
MALNPQLHPSGFPLPFVNEVLALARDGVEFQVEKLPDVPSGKIVTKGTIYLSNIRLVFVARQPVGNFFAFDMPLMFIHEESFNQPIFFCNNLSGKVHPVIQEGANPALYAPYPFKILFKEGGVGTFIPIFFGLLRSIRATESMRAAAQNPIPETQAPVDDMIRHAYIDPNDPTRLYLQQPLEPESELRRRHYNAPIEQQVSHY